MKNIWIVFVCILTLTGCSSMQNVKNTETEDVVQETINSETESSTTIIQRPAKVETEVESEIETEEESEVVIPEVVIPEGNYSLMQQVLFNQKEFFGEIAYPNEVDWYTIDDFITREVLEEGRRPSFRVIDLDHDGMDEVCVSFNQYVLILHESEGVVYGHFNHWKLFNSLYVDGTFETSSNSSGLTFWGNISFDKNEFQCEEIASISPDEDENGNIITRYYKTDEVNGEKIEITKEEYKEFVSKYSKEQPEFYDYTVEDILEYVK